jgi:putative phosphoesterase
MILGVFSDSHGNVDYLENAASYAARRGGADVFIHLGDNYSDAKVLNQFGKRLIQVPGVFAPQYKDPSVANRILETFGQWNVLVSHTSQKHLNDLPSDIDPEEMLRNRTIQVLLHGHTHDARIEESQGVWHINPGHLKRNDKKNRPASFALVDLRDSDATAQIIDVVNHTQLLNRDFSFRQ